MISQKYIVDQNTWNKESIEHRTECLIEFILKQLLPVPNYLFNSISGGTRPKKKKNYVELGLVGKIIHYKDDRSIVARIVSEDKIEYEGEQISISTLTKKIKLKRSECKPDASFNGKLFWVYNGKTIFDLSEN